MSGSGHQPTTERVLAALPDWVYRLFKLSPWRYHTNRKRWERRTYPCSRWWCFRRSPAWRSFSREGRGYCDKHVPRHPPDVTITVDSVVTGGYSAPGKVE